MDLVALNTAPTLTVPLATNAKDLFKGCTSFNQDLSGLDTSNVITVESMLEGATAFNESLPDLVGTIVPDYKPIVNSSDFLNGHSTVHKLHIGYRCARMNYWGYWPVTAAGPGQQNIAYGASFTGSYDDALNYTITQNPITTDGYFVLGLYFSGSAVLQANEVKKQMQKLMVNTPELSVFAPDTNNSVENSDNNKYDNNSITETIENIMQDEEEGTVKKVKIGYLSLRINYNNLMEKSKTERNYDMNFDPIEYVEVVELNDTLPITDFNPSIPVEHNPMRALFITNDTYVNTNYYGQYDYFWTADTFVFPTPNLLDRIIASTKATHTAHTAAGWSWLNWTYGDIEDIDTTIKRTTGTTYSVENMKSLLKNASSYSGNIGKINPLAGADLESVFEGTNVVDVPFTYMDDTTYSITSLKNTFKNATNFSGDVRTIPVGSSTDFTDTITGTTYASPLPGFNENDYTPGLKTSITITDGDGTGFTNITPTTADGWVRENGYGYTASRSINLGTKKLRIGSQESSQLYWGGGRIKFTYNSDYTETVAEFYSQGPQICWSWDDTTGVAAWYKITEDQLLLWVDARSYAAADDDHKQCYLEINLTNHSNPDGVKFIYGDTNSGVNTSTGNSYWNPRDGIVGISYGSDSITTTSNTIDFTQNGSTQFIIPNCAVQLFAQSYTIGDGMDGMTNKIVEFITSPGVSEAFPAGDYFELTYRYFMKHNTELTKSIGITKFSEGLHDYLYGAMEQYYTKHITDMSYAFKDYTTFNKDIGAWDTSNVTSLKEMFRGASAFNQPIGDWDTSIVTNMYGMFYNASAFNQNICNWDVSKATTIGHMFNNAASFDGRYTALPNQSGRINTWNVQPNTTVSVMFDGSNIFAHPFTSPEIAGVYKPEWFEVDGVTPKIGDFFNSDIPCFDATTTILAKRTETSEPSYIPVNKLMKGHLVQTHKNGFKPILHVGTTSVCLNMEGSELKDQMYRMKKNDNMTHDLLVTGRHSVLVDDWSSHHCKKRRTELSTATIEDKHILGAGYSTLFTQETKPTEYQIYHIALDGKENRYGLYANGGILCESLDKRSINKLSHEGPQLMKE
jgi:surface protein